MSSPTATVDHFSRPLRWNASQLCSVALVTALLVWATLAGNSALAVYSLSFWHYYLYGLAYYYGAVPLAVFKRDAVSMKTVALAALGYVYLAAPLNAASLAVVIAGFLLNCLAAKALGSDRTYYGYEVANLPPRRITAFPYSWIAHPMLIGNIAAYGGTLLNADFRRQWWPLACTHVALNLGLLLMEISVTPQRLGARAAAQRFEASVRSRYSLQTALGRVVAGAAIAAAFTWRGEWDARMAFPAIAGACCSAYAYAVYCCYAGPQSPPDGRPEKLTEETL